MGNRTSLLLKDAGGETTELLEGVTYFPLFWLLGTLSEPMKAQIERAQTLTEPAEADYADEDDYSDAYSEWFYSNQLGEVSVPIGAFTSNLEAHKPYIAEQHSPLVGLYQRFIGFITEQARTHPDASVYIDYSELTDFSDTVADYHQEMSQAVDQISGGQQVGPDWFDPTDVLLSTIGTDEYSDHTGERLFTSETFDSTERQLVQAFRAKPNQQNRQAQPAQPARQANQSEPTESPVLFESLESPEATEAPEATLAYTSIQPSKASFFQKLFRRRS
ncbi:hypothetical protein KIM372_02150 [Bombiscardovia nodaiensis]|uniref:Uncharacterized protein n=1 Tax=Bombiscardovia nodaiensis TaxID=2932181 RepID=A0ABN6SAR4_9BIFI|nr:hypothetical protein KIM372_02150 [Bombiscardovia nodaiensis]